MLPDFCIKRPVFATVFSLLLVTFGIVTYLRLPLREYPDIDTPVISISTTYTGASASVVESKITQIIEGSVSSIDGLRTIESSSEDGQSSVSVEFDISRNIDEAANDVRDKVSRVAGVLPEEADAPRIAKRSTGGMPDLILGLSHPTMTQMELTDYADRYPARQVLGRRRRRAGADLRREALLHADLAQSEGARGSTIDGRGRRGRAPNGECRAAGRTLRVDRTGVHGAREARL